MLPVGGEESTIEFMESESLIDSNTPLLKEAYAYGVVEHPFPLNCFLRYWYLGRDFYNAVKIGIVQYVCAHFLIESYCRFLFLLHFTASVWYLLRHYFPDDIKDDLCTASNDSRNFWGLWRREVWLEIRVRHPYLPFKVFWSACTSITHTCSHPFISAQMGNL